MISQDALRTTPCLAPIGVLLLVGCNREATLPSQPEAGIGTAVELGKMQTIDVTDGDRFEGNGLGALIAGGTATSGMAVSNSATFEARGSAFVNNTGPVDPEFGDAGGLLVLGADTPGYSNGTFHNTVAVRLWGTRVFGNQNIDFQVFGSRSLEDPPALGGTDNHAVVELHGVSSGINVVAVDSSPEDPNHTNTATVVRGR